MKNHLLRLLNPVLILLFFLSIMPGKMVAQVQVDKQIQLTGSGSDAKITGIQSVTNTQDATSVGSIQSGSFIYAVANGSNNNLSLTISPPIASYAPGMVFNFISNQTISGPTTLNVNNQEVVPIVKYINQAFTGCEIQNGQIVTVVYDGTNFQITSIFASYAAMPGTISGTDTVCPNATGLVYSINPVSGATGYNWTVPAGATITANAGTPNITVNFGANPAGNITVSATNACPSSPPSILTTVSATLPTVFSTTAATAITTGSAASGGDVSSDGGAPATAYGVCWSTSPNPVLGIGNYTTDGADTGTFTSGITGLTASTTYYVCAYATNCVGTAYGPQISFTTNTPVTIGQSYEGGIVAYILQPGDASYDPNVQHGLIVATSDQSTGIAWWNGTYTTTGATGTAIGTGRSNTDSIIASQGPGTYAATVCTGYTGGGYTDWYLPSIDELNELCINQPAIFPGGETSYWSSTEYNNTVAWFENIPICLTYNNYYTKSSAAPSLRAVRSF